MPVPAYPDHVCLWEPDTAATINLAALDSTLSHTAGVSLNRASGESCAESFGDALLRYVFVSIVKAAQGKLYVGTSGWTYADWRGPFFPEEIPKRCWLKWYAGQFNCTEINASFYRTPSCEAVRLWAKSTPRGFRFAWKASKFITHWKRLGPTSKNSIELLESRLSMLGAKCGPVLFQLPARFEADQFRLADFLQMLPRRYRYAFEFRRADWYTDSTLSLLHKSNVALCISDHHDAPSPWLATADHVYVRAHGPTGQYKGQYSSATLEKWSRSLDQWRAQGRTVHVYFDNDQKSAAPKDAQRLSAILVG
jgi:uncharacterized protein YecE (DUF72 family)